MSDGAALRLALDLFHVPWRVRLARREALPEGVPLLLRIAAGDAAAEQEAVKLADRPQEVIRQAATFFIEQILLAPDADSYRVLGASPAVVDGELRRNMASLMTWLHPDVTRESDRAVFAPRITAAWNDLKTPERRAAYDAARRMASKVGKHTSKRARPRAATPYHIGRANNRVRGGANKPRGLHDAFSEPPTGLRRVLSLLFGFHFRGRRF